MPLYYRTGIGNAVAKAAWGWENCLCELIMSRSRVDLITLNLAGNALPKLLLN